MVLASKLLHDFWFVIFYCFKRKKGKFSAINRSEAGKKFHLIVENVGV